MATLTATKIASLDRNKQHGKYADGLGLYFVVPKKGHSYWSYRYTVHGKRREMTLGKYPFMGLADARSELLLKKRELLNGLDPLVARKREAWSGIETMDHLFEDWFTNDIQPRLKHPNIPARLYRKEMKPVIGDMRIEQVTARDVREVLQRVKKGKGIVIPLPSQAVEWFHMLKARSFGSDYVLPARRGSNRPSLVETPLIVRSTKCLAPNKAAKDPGLT